MVRRRSMAARGDKDVNILEKVLAAYGEVAETTGLPEMAMSSLCRLEPQHFADEDALWQTFEAFAPQEGWLCFQSVVRVFTAGRLERGRPEEGRLLHAEAVNARNESLRIRPDGNGGWWFDVFTEEGGEPCLVDEVSFLRRGGGRVHYRRYWRHEEFHGVHPFTARFVGFSEGKK